MNRKVLQQGLTLLYDDTDKDYAESLEHICIESRDFAQAVLGLNIPADIHIHVMTSWPSFYFHSSTRKFKLIILLFPLFFLFGLLSSYLDGNSHWGQYLVLLTTALFYFAWLAIRVNSVWKNCSGWHANFNERRAIGIKPPRISKLANSEIGKRIYIENLSPDEKNRSMLSHEMTHAFTAHIKHPAWLREGLAMVVADRFLGKQTIRTDTLEILKQPSANKFSRSHSLDSSVLLYARGYWRTRYLVETNRELLGLLFNPQYKAADFAKLIADSYGEDTGHFWSNNRLDQMLLRHYGLS